MDETKPWWASKTIWASVLTIGLGLLAGLHWTHIGPVQVDQVGAEQSNIADLLTEIGVIVSGFVALYGRLTAKAKLGPGSGA